MCLHFSIGRILDSRVRIPSRSLAECLRLLQHNLFINAKTLLQLIKSLLFAEQKEAIALGDFVSCRLDLLSYPAQGKRQ
jgi:hypothetical protein